MRAAGSGEHAAFCGEVLRRHDPDRYLCCLFTTRRRRDALFSLFAFNFEVARIREAAADPTLGRIRLQWWRDAVAAVASGCPDPNPVSRGLAGAFRDFGLDPAPFDRVIEARERDFDDGPMATLTALTAYAEDTGAGLLPAALRILGHDTPEALVRAQDIAVAGALTGLLRATPFLARVGRCVLPTGYGLSEREYYSLRDHAGLRRTACVVAGQARQRLERARLLNATPFRSLAPVLLPGRLAHLYLKRLDRAGWNALDPAVNRPMPMKPWILSASALLRRI